MIQHVNSYNKGTKFTVQQKPPEILAKVSRCRKGKNMKRSRTPRQETVKSHLPGMHGGRKRSKSYISVHTNTKKELRRKLSLSAKQRKAAADRELERIYGPQKPRLYTLIRHVYVQKISEVCRMKNCNSELYEALHRDGCLCKRQKKADNDVPKHSYHVVKGNKTYELRTKAVSAKYETNKNTTLKRAKSPLEKKGNSENLKPIPMTKAQQMRADAVRITYGGNEYNVPNIRSVLRSPSKATTMYAPEVRMNKTQLMRTTALWNGANSPCQVDSLYGSSRSSSQIKQAGGVYTSMVNKTYPTEIGRSSMLIPKDVSNLVCSPRMVRSISRHTQTSDPDYIDTTVQTRAHAPTYFEPLHSTSTSAEVPMSSSSKSLPTMLPTTSKRSMRSCPSYKTSVLTSSKELVLPNPTKSAMSTSAKSIVSNEQTSKFGLTSTNVIESTQNLLKLTQTRPVGKQVLLAPIKSLSKSSICAQSRTLLDSSMSGTSLITLSRHPASIPIQELDLSSSSEFTQARPKSAYSKSLTTIVPFTEASTSSSISPSSSKSFEYIPLRLIPNPTTKFNISLAVSATSTTSLELFASHSRSFSSPGVHSGASSGSNLTSDSPGSSGSCLTSDSPGSSGSCLTSESLLSSMSSLGDSLTSILSSSVELLTPIETVPKPVSVARNLFGESTEYRLLQEKKESTIKAAAKILRSSKPASTTVLPNNGPSTPRPFTVSSAISPGATPQTTWTIPAAPPIKRLLTRATCDKPTLPIGAQVRLHAASYPLPGNSSSPNAQRTPESVLPWQTHYVCHPVTKDIPAKPPDVQSHPPT